MKLAWRDDFPILTRKCNDHPLIYLDTAATALKPRPVLEAMHNFYTWHSGTVHRAVHMLAHEATHAYEEARRKVQKFLHAEHFEEIIFTRGTTASLNLVAQAFAKAYLKPHDGILITEIEHHSNIVPWQMVTQEYNASLIVAPIQDDGTLDLYAFEKILKEGRVKLVSLAHISNVIGTIHPIEKIIHMAHAYGAYVCVDGAQSAPHLTIDVQKLDVDFYAFSGHKMYGPHGIGVLYGKRALLEKMPPIEGGGDMIDQVTFSGSTFNRLPLKFEAGTPSIAEAVGLGYAIDYINQLGLDSIQSHEQSLTAYTLERLHTLAEIKILGNLPYRGSLISFSHQNFHALDLAILLDCQGIAVRSGHLCSQPALERFKIPSCLRLSFGLYNVIEEIDRFFMVLKKNFKN